MATNLLAPNGLSFNRNSISGANTYMANVFKIKAGYATAIGRGDLVKTLTGASQGYVGLSLLGDSGSLGVFQAVLPYYDLSQQATAHGLVGSWPTTANPSADVDVLIVNDPFATFIAQVSGGTYAASWRGQNINFLAGSNGAPNGAGVSTLALDYTTLGTTNTLPFRIVGPVGVTGGPNDPANTNPWVEVRLNTAEALSSTGI